MQDLNVSTIPHNRLSSSTQRIEYFQPFDQNEEVGGAESSLLSLRLDLEWTRSKEIADQVD